MRLLLHSAALKRVETRLTALGLPLEIVTVDNDRVIREGGRVLAPEEVRPEAVWLSLDTYVGRQLRQFLDLTLGSDTVRYVQTFNAGLDGPHFRQMFDRGIKIANSSAQAPSIAEYVLAHVLAEWHPLARQRENQRAHRWGRIPFREMGDAHWLIIGFGHIGREIARRVRPFGSRITAVRRTQTLEPLMDAIAPPAALPDLLPQADIVVLAVGLSADTANMANAGFFARMKPGSILVNIGRGGLLDEDALLAALDKNAPAVAILDVFREEPLPTTSPLWDHPKLRLTPHTSAGGHGTLLRGDELFLGNLPRYARGEPLVNEVTERTFG
jgi:phosphoglycerate dehydrogenase-like enzyme